MNDAFICMQCSLQLHVGLLNCWCIGKAELGLFKHHPYHDQHSIGSYISQLFGSNTCMEQPAGKYKYAMSSHHAN